MFDKKIHLIDIKECMMDQRCNENAISRMILIAFCSFCAVPKSPSYSREWEFQILVVNNGSWRLQAEQSDVSKQGPSGI